MSSQGMSLEAPRKAQGTRVAAARDWQITMILFRPTWSEIFPPRSDPGTQTAADRNT